MKTRLGLILQRLKVLSDLADLEHSTTADLYRGDQNDTVVSALEMMKARVEPAPCRAALKAFLEALPESYVLAIAALMYAGRDNDAKVLANWRGFGGLNPEESIQAIVEKTPRMQYIATAVSLQHSDSFLEELPAMIMGQSTD